jgi:hypothetical protein
MILRRDSVGSHPFSSLVGHPHGGVRGKYFPADALETIDTKALEKMCRHKVLKMLLKEEKIRL